MIAVAQTTKTTRSRKEVSNLPHWRDGWTTREGKTKQGFWQFRYKGKYVSLARFGAPEIEGGKRELQLAIEARDRFLALRGDEEAQAAMEAAAKAGELQTVWGVMMGYVTKHLPTCSKGFRTSAKAQCEDFARRYGKLPAESITFDHLDQWTKDFPPGSKRNGISAVRAAYNFSIDRGLIAKNPVSRYKVPRSGKRTEVFEDSEIKLVQESKKTSPAFLTFFNACLECPSRPGEIAKLSGRHVRQTAAGSVVWVLQPNEWKNGKKTGRERIIPLSAKWAEWTRKRMEEVVDLNEPLFKTTRGNRWTDTYWGKNLRDLAEKIGLRAELDMYHLRHTAITKYIKAGVPVAKIAVMFGTSVSEIERTYSKYLREVDDMAALVEMVSGN